MVTNLGLYKTLGKGDSIEHRTLDELPQAIYLRGRSSPGSGRAISPAGDNPPCWWLLREEETTIQPPPRDRQALLQCALHSMANTFIRMLSSCASFA